MNRQTVSLDAFQIIGINTRTSNQDEMKGTGKIPALWNKFYSEQALSKIPGKLNSDIIAVYHDYESDASAPYSVLIGAKVAPGTKAPEGMELLNIPAQKYAKITSAKGEMPGVVIDAWKTVWNLTEKSELNRTYTFDLEVYDQRTANPKSAEVDLFITIK